MNRNRVTVTVLSLAVAWAAWKVHAGAGPLGPVSWAAAIAITAIGITVSYVLLTAAAGGGWRPRT